MHAVQPETGQASPEADALIEHLPVGIFRARLGADGTLHVASLNAEARRIFGHETGGWVSVDPHGLPGAGVDEVAAIARQQHEQPARSSWTGDIVTPTGVRTIEGSTTPTGRDGDAILLQGYVLDVTERRRAERATDQVVSELADAQRIGRIGSWLFVPGDRNTWSDEMCRIHGLAPGTPIPDDPGWYARFLAPAEFARLQEVTAQGMREASGYEVAYELHRPDGTTRHVLSRGAPLLGADGSVRGVRGTTVDITDLVAARTALAASERLHRTLVEALAEAVIVQDLDGRIVTANPAAERILGIRLDELTGLSSMDPRWQALHEDGTPVPGEQHPAMITLRTGAPVRDAVMQIAHPEHDRVWLRINSSPLHDDAGRLVATVVSFEDITSAKAAHEAELRFNEELERRVLERTAALAAANEELRVFSATVSHDLRAPVRAVAGFARLLQKRYADAMPDEAAHYVDNLVVAGETMGRLIDDFLAYARFGSDGLSMGPVALPPIVDWLRASLVERLVETGATLRVEEPLETPVGDPALLRRMLLNLVDNALTYGRSGVAPEVVLAAHREGDRVVISVSDTGRGIDLTALERIFEVFARVEPDQDLAHAGMGLAMVRKAARAMGTEVEVVSVPNEGSTFRFSLPAADAEHGA